MARIKRLPDDERRALRTTLHDVVAQGGYPWAKSIQHMRRSLGMTQEQFAKAFRLTKRQLSKYEAGSANPTVETLERIGRPFGFEIGYIIRRVFEETSTPPRERIDDEPEASPSHDG